MLKIAFINMYQGMANRGAETFVSELTRIFLLKFKVTVISGNEKPKARWPILWRAFIDPNGLSGLFFALRLIPKLLREKYDLIIPVNGGWMPAIVRIVTWMYGGKMIISGQSGVGWDERNNLWCFPDAFVALSQMAAKWAKHVNPLVNVYEIPNGVDTKLFSPVNFEKKPKKTRLVLCVAALTRDKRIDLVIRAVSKINNVKLLLCGEGGDSQKQLISLGKKLMGDRFIYKKVTHSQMPGIYKSADVFTLASKPFFAFEIAIIEALSSGLPVVVNDDPVRREIVGNAGKFVNPQNTTEYTSALRLALKSGVNYKGIKRARDYGWEKVARKYIDVFRKINLN